MLGQHIQRQREWPACFDHAFGQGTAHRGVLGQFQRMAGHAQDGAAGTRAVACTSGALAQARHAFRAAQLQYLFNLGEVHAKVEAGRSHHAAQRARSQSVFHLLAQCRIQRAVVQRKRVLVLGPDRGQCLMPQFCLRTGVGEQQAAACPHQCVQHPRQLRQAQMPGPGETFAGVRQQAAHADRARAHALHDRRVGLSGQQHVARLFQIAQRCRQPPQLQCRRGIA